MRLETVSNGGLGAFKRFYLLNEFINIERNYYEF